MKRIINTSNCVCFGEMSLRKTTKRYRIKLVNSLHSIQKIDNKLHCSNSWVSVKTELLLLLLQWYYIEYDKHFCSWIVTYVCSSVGCNYFIIWIKSLTFLILSKENLQWFVLFICIGRQSIHDSSGMQDSPKRNTIQWSNYFVVKAAGLIIVYMASEKNDGILIGL